MACRRQCTEWKSLPGRFARLILNATRHKQAERWDIGQIKGELQSLTETLFNPDTIQSAELIAEEIVNRTRFDNNYTWDQDKLAATINLTSGVYISISGDESQRRVKLNIIWNSTGEHEWRKIHKWLPETAKRVQGALSKGGWQIIDINKHSPINEQSLFLSAYVSVETARSRLSEIADSIDNSIDHLRFK